LVKAVGEDRLLMLPYEEFRETPTIFLAKVLQFVMSTGIQDPKSLAENLLATSYEKQNVRSLSRTTWEIRPLVNTNMPSIPLRPGFLFRAFGINQGLLHFRWPEIFRGKTIELTSELKQQVQATYERSNRALASSLGVELSQYNYYS